MDTGNKDQSVLNQENAKESHPDVHNSEYRIIWTLAIILLVLLVVFGVWYFFLMQSNEDSQEGGSTSTSVQSGQEFQQMITAAGDLARSGDKEAALRRFQELIEAAQTPAQEGQAKLNLAVWRLGSDRVAAVEMLKEVSTNELYTDPVRAKAANYVLNEYTATYDESFARTHIFTGPIWGDFLTADTSLSQAALKGFEFSSKIAPTPEATMRVASEHAFQIIDVPGLTEEEKDMHAQIAIDHIDAGNEAIELLRESGEIGYGKTDFTEIAVSYNRKATALDVLYFQGYIDDPDRVEDAFEDALNTILENKGGVGTELFIRYHYADFLLRLGGESREAGIQKILAPMGKMRSDHNAAKFFRSWVINDEVNAAKDDSDLAKPDNIKRLASISPEFKDALIRIGVSKDDLLLNNENES